MRRPVSVLFIVFLAGCFASLISLFVVSEAQSATYSQVVDNTTQGRFSASSKWITSDYHRTADYGSNYRALRQPASTAGTAKWKVKIPARGTYTVYAWWAADPGYTGSATYKIKAASGWKSKAVNQRTNGGRWMKLGSYTMTAGDDWKIALASTTSSKGYIIADAVKVVRGTMSSTDGGTNTTSTTGADVVAEARKHIGKPYVYGAAGPNSFDCSGFTQYVYKQFGKSLPHSAASQYNYGRSVSRAELKPGDLIFGNAGGSGIQHVGIYAGKNSSGQRLMIHAGTPQTDVEITTYESWYTEIGYRRLIG